MLSLVRKLALVAVAAYATVAQACSFYTDRKFQELAAVYEMSLANRAVAHMREESRLRDFVYAQQDPFLYDTFVRDGQGEEFGYETEEKNRKKAAKDALRVVGKSGAEALEQVIKGTGIPDVLIENPKFEEHQVMGSIDKPYVASAEPKRERSRKIVSPKINPGIKGFRAGVDLGESLSFRWKSEYDLEDAEIEAKLRMRVLHEFYLAGIYERKLYEHTDSYGGGIFWRKLGATYSQDHNDDGMFLLEFNSSRK